MKSFHGFGRRGRHFGGRGDLRGEGRGGGRGGRFGRLLQHGDLKFLILGLIAEKGRHGYELIKEIEDKLAGAYSPSPGVIYPTLQLLEELGWICAVESDGAKKRYEITEEGRMSLVANKAILEGLETRMAEIAHHSKTHGESDEGEGPAPQIRKAMKRLKGTLRARFMGRPPSDEQIAKIAAALDSAAEAIENA